MLVLEYLEMYMFLSVMLALPETKENLIMSALFRFIWGHVELFYYALILLCPVT
jgi:hypothetical protein